MNDKRINEALLGLEEVGMKMAIAHTWSMNKDELLEKFKEVCKEYSVDEGVFAALNLIGACGVVLTDKYEVDKGELIEIFENITGRKL